VPNTLGGYDITASDLVVWSLTPVPCNPFAVRTLKSLGLWRGDERVIEVADSPLLRKLEAERIQQGTRRALRHHYGGDTVIEIEDAAPKTYDLTPADLAQIAATIVRSALQGVDRSIETAVAAALNRARGRVD
jgi:hypothetical protein